MCPLFVEKVVDNKDLHVWFPVYKRGRYMKLDHFVKIFDKIRAHFVEKFDVRKIFDKNHILFVENLDETQSGRRGSIPQIP